MLERRNIVRGLRKPSLLPILLRRLFPWRALRADQECSHLIKSWSSGRLPRTTLIELFAGAAQIDVTLRSPYSRVIGWSVDLPELVCILTIMKHIEAKQVLEIGTYDGFVALNLAANIANDGLVYTVDLPPTYRDLNGKAEPISNACAGELLGRKFEAVPEARNIRQILCDSTALDWSAMGGPFDLIFIDGCHDRYYVERDTANAFANLSEGGVVLWHDYGQFPDVSSVVDGWACRYPIYALKGTRLAIYSSALDRPCNQVDRETVQLGRTPRGGR